jgi:hypothetical protein
MSEEDQKEFVEEWDKQHTHTHGKGVTCHACTGSDDDKKSMCLIYWLESRRTLREKIRNNEKERLTLGSVEEV